VYSLIVQHPLKIGAKSLFDGRLDIVGFAWAPSKLTKAWMRLWLWYADEQQFPDCIEPLFHVFGIGSKRNIIGDLPKCV
jgi:hypothetical protein